MKIENEEQGSSKRTRWLTQGLMLSGALNVALLITFVYLLVVQDTTHEGVDGAKVTTVAPVKESPAIVEVIHEYQKYSFEQLVTELDKAQHLEDGLANRDLALAVLVSQYHFNLPAALGGDPVTYRQLVFQNKESNIAGELVVASGLTEHQFRKVIYYVRTERWPYTAEGLFLMLKQNGEGKQPDNSLLEAFYMTSEFGAVVVLFAESSPEVSKPVLLSLLLSGDWQTLSQFVQKQRVAANISPQQRQKFLLDYTMQGSEQAANLLLQEDFNFVAKKLDDQQAIRVVNILEKRSDVAEKFAVELLTSPRSDAVWKAAAARLYAFAGQAMPEPYDHHGALKRFVSKEALNTKVAEAPATRSSHANVAATEKRSQATSQEYTIQKGDNLWKLARRFHTNVKVLREMNALQSDRLNIGQKLKIPVDKASSSQE